MDSIALWCKAMREALENEEAFRKAKQKERQHKWYLEHREEKLAALHKKRQMKKQEEKNGIECKSNH